MDFLFLWLYIIYFILLSYYSDNRFYPKIRRGIVVAVMIYYLFDGYYDNYIRGLIVAFVLNCLIVAYIFSLKLFKSKMSKMFFVIVGSLFLFFVIVVSHIFHGVSGDSDFVKLIENEKYIIESKTLGSGGAGMFDTGPPSRYVYYLDKTKFLNDRECIFRFSGYNFRKELNFNFISTDSLSLEVVGLNNYSRTYYKPILFDLDNNLKIIDNKNFHNYLSIDTLKTNKQVKVYNHAGNDKYVISFIRQKADSSQIIGNHVIKYGSIYQDEAEVLFDVLEGDYAEFEYLNDSTVKITYYSNIITDKKHSMNDVRHVFEITGTVSKIYDYSDIYVFNYKDIPDKNLLLERREQKKKKLKSN